jgi:hypothetical protein
VWKVRREGREVYVLSILDQAQIERVLERVWDEKEFRSEHGLRSLSKFHQEHAFVMDGQSVGYEPAESRCSLKGGNSNWRGPIWFPTTLLMIESLRKVAAVFGDEMKVRPNGSETAATPGCMAEYFSNRLIGLFQSDGAGRRPVDGLREKAWQDPHWRDLICFHEYFDGDTGAGLGASHQTGWTGLVATVIDETPG